MATVDVSVLDVEGDKSLAFDVDSLAECLIHRLALSTLGQDRDDVLHLLGFQLELPVSLRFRIQPWALRVRSPEDGGRWGFHTTKPGLAAQTLSPAALMMAALSIWPVATRLFHGVSKGNS